MRSLFVFTLTFATALIVGTLINVFIFGDAFQTAIINGLAGAFGGSVAVTYIAHKKQKQNQAKLSKKV